MCVCCAVSCLQHCLYNLPRQRLHELLDIPPAADGASYYSFSPHPRWLFVVLDAYDISLLGWPDTHPRHLQAEAILNRENPNKVSLTAPVCVGASLGLCDDGRGTGGVGGSCGRAGQVSSCSSG